MKLAAFVLLAGLLSCSSLKESWPPRVGAPFPDIEFLNHRGEKLRLSTLRGKLVIVEMIGMSCGACQAFSGGSYERVTPQRGVKPFEEYLSTYARVTLDDPRLVFVQILLYDLSLGAPNASHAASWARRYGFDRRNNVQVVVPVSDLRSDASYNLIPGFQLLDTDLVVRSDSTGHHPREDLFRELLPMVPKLLGERAVTANTNSHAGNR